MISLVAVLCFLASFTQAAEPPPAIHYILQRRGGAFSPNWTANLPYLAEQLEIAESRFNFTRREVRGNKIVRIPKLQAEGGGFVQRLIGQHARDGKWFSFLKLGDPKQTIELDIDMLTRDFAVTTTSSQKGSRFEDFFSKTYAENPLQMKPFSNCGFPSDSTLLPTVNVTFQLSFAHCKPSKQSTETLAESGAIYGLAPSDSLSQMDPPVPSLMKQLIEGKFIEQEVFSLTLLNGAEGLLSLGGTVAQAVARVEERIQGFLQNPRTADEDQKPQTPMNFGARTDPGTPDQIAETHGFAPLGGNGLRKRDEVEEPVQGAPNLAEFKAEKKLLKRQEPEHQETLEKRDVPETPVHGAPTLQEFKAEKRLHKRQFLPDSMALKTPTYEGKTKQRGRARPDGHHLPTWRDEWKWSPVEGAAGWWQILMRGIWTNGVRILKNQPCIIDINTPFILAPPLAAKAFYQSVSGSKRLPPPYSSFYAYPCNNPPQLHLEFGGWRFPVFRGTKSAVDQRGPNGKFSLGKVAEDTGYCVGAIVETKIGVGDASPVRKQVSQQELGGGFGRLESGMLAGNGLRDVWILGEHLFKGIGVVFDMTTKEVGFRTY